MDDRINVPNSYVYISQYGMCLKRRVRTIWLWGVFRRHLHILEFGHEIDWTSGGGKLWDLVNVVCVANTLGYFPKLVEIEINVQLFHYNLYFQ